MPLRPALEAARERLFRLLSATVERPGNNSSHLVLGARGTGKTLVRARRAFPPLHASLQASRIPLKLRCLTALSCSAY